MIAPERHRFAALDAWRGVAALAVAYRHINGTAPLLDNPFHDHLARGVDFFFVLSGFVIACAYGERLARGFSPVRFMGLRWGRIWPLHAAMVLIYLALECLLLLAGRIGPIAGREAFTGPRDLAALPVSFLLLQEWVWPGRDLWNVQSWSVSVELALYVAAGAALRWLGPRALWLGGGLALALGLAEMANLAGLPQHFLRGLVGFGLGMAGWAVWPCVARVRMGPVAASGVELALVGAVVVLVTRGVDTLAIDLVFAALVLVFGREQGMVSRLLLTAPLRWLGVLSYGLYMVHGLVFGRVFDLLALIQRQAGAQWVAARLGGEDLILLGPAATALLTLAMLALALGCAWLAWRFVEWPARQLSRRWLAPGQLAAGHA